MGKNRKLEIMSCTGCGFCRKGCPVFEERATEASSGKGKVLLSYGLLQGDILVDDSVIKALQECSLCKQCENTCPSLIDIPLIISQARKNLGLLPSHQKMVDNVHSSGNPFGKKIKYDRGDPESTLGYFPGCISNIYEKNIKNATMSVLKKIGMTPRVLNGTCCNLPLQRIGVTDPVPTWDLTGLDTLVFSCPACYYAFKKSLKDPPKLLHITEFLLSQPLHLKSLHKRVMYHDSCYLGRWMGIYEPPRKLLKRIPDIALIEFDDNRKHARCSGSELEFQVAFPSLAQKMGTTLLMEAQNKDAHLITASPHCSHHLHTLGGTATDIVELINDCLISPANTS